MLLGEEKFADTRRDLLKGKDVSREIVTMTEDKLPLWQAMRAVLEQAGELQVVDLQDVLEFLKISAFRQAIESALASHKETFETKFTTGTSLFRSSANKGIQPVLATAL